MSLEYWEHEWKFGWENEKAWENENTGCNKILIATLIIMLVFLK